MDAKEVRAELVKDGHTYQKMVSHKKLMSVLEKHSTFATGLLPPNTRYYQKSGDQYVVLVEIPPMKRTMIVKHDGHGRQIVIDNVPMSAGAFFFNIHKDPRTQNYQISRPRLFALPFKGLQGFEDQLYRYPTPNVDIHGGICWGSNHGVIEGLKCLSGLEGAVRAFFRTNFNDHIWGYNALTNKFDWKGMSWRAVEQYFQELANFDQFDDDWLLPTAQTVKKVLQSMRANT